MKFNYNKINQINGNTPFRYVTIFGIVDFFEYTLSKQQIIDNIKENQSFSRGSVEEMERIEKFVKKYVTEIEEEPFVRYVSLPNIHNNDMELIAIARISNNGLSFIFSNDYNHLDYMLNI